MKLSAVQAHLSTILANSATVMLSLGYWSRPDPRRSTHVTIATMSTYPMRHSISQWAKNQHDIIRTESSDLKGKWTIFTSNELSWRLEISRKSSFSKIPPNVLLFSAVMGFDASESDLKSKVLLFVRLVELIKSWKSPQLRQRMNYTWYRW